MSSTKLGPVSIDIGTDKSITISGHHTLKSSANPRDVIGGRGLSYTPMNYMSQTANMSGTVDFFQNAISANYGLSTTVVQRGHVSRISSGIELQINGNNGWNRGGSFQNAPVFSPSPQPVYLYNGGAIYSPDVQTIPVQPSLSSSNFKSDVTLNPEAVWLIVAVFVAGAAAIIVSGGAATPAVVPAVVAAITLIGSTYNTEDTSRENDWSA
jgi:hypothetical protein